MRLKKWRWADLTPWNRRELDAIGGRPGDDDDTTVERNTLRQHEDHIVVSSAVELYHFLWSFTV